MKAGDRVVCVKSHSEGFVKKGQEFILTGVYDFCCTKAVSVGIHCSHNYVRCTCGEIHEANKTEMVFGSDLFRKVNFTNEITKALANGHEEIKEYNPKELEREKV